MRPCSRSACRRRWGSWSGLRRRDFWRCRSRWGLVCCASSWSRRSRGSSGRGGSGTVTAPRSVTAARAARSRSAGVVCAGQPAAGQDGGRRVRGAAFDLRALRRPRSAGGCGGRADAGRGLDAPVPTDAGTGRHGGRGGRPVDLEVGGVPRVRAADPRPVVDAGEPAAGRPAPGGGMLDGIDLHGRTNISRWGSRRRATS